MDSIRRRKISSACLLVSLLLSLGVAGAPAGAETNNIVLVGLRVVDESGVQIENARLVTGEHVLAHERSGILSAQVKQARRYQLTVLAPGYYTILHTFSDQERQLFDGIFPVVTLVKKIPGRVMIALAGDAMMGRRYHKPNPGDPLLISHGSRLDDSKALLKTIKPYLDLADYTSINLETPVVLEEPGDKSTKGVTFFSYPETLEALSWAGVDHVSLGNNHTYDYLAMALQETLDRVAKSGLGSSGAGMNADAALQPFRTSIQGVDYSFFGYVGWAGRVLPSQVAEGDSKGGAALGTAANIARSLDAENRGRVSVVEYHGSDEYSFEPTDETRDRLRTAIDNGADIAIGHHPHVLHGFEIYKGKLIAYSLGNFMFDQYIYETQRSALLYVWMDGDVFHRAESVPLYIKTYRPTPAMGRVREYVLRRVIQQSSLEGVDVSLSGGHAVISNEVGSVTDTSSTMELAVGPGEQLIELDSWQERFQEISFARSGIAYRIGRDWWALGDHEQEQQYELLDRSWKFSNRESGISSEKALENYAMKIVIPKKEGRASVGQQYFMRVWDDNHKTIALDVYAQGTVEVRACLELRTRAMTTEQGRSNPFVRCLDEVTVTAGEWRQLLFDFDPPPRADHRGIRFRFEVSAKGTDASSVSNTVYFDNLKFISWDNEGVSEKGQSVSLVGDKRWNMMEISSPAPGEVCCQLIKEQLIKRI